MQSLGIAIPCADSILDILLQKIKSNEIRNTIIK